MLGMATFKVAYGYGRFWVKHNEVRSAHRTAYEDEYGPIPEGYVVHHVCRKKGCVNPIHLEILPTEDHGRHHCLDRGTLISDAQAEEIRDLYRSGKRQQIIAARFGISQNYVSSIVNNKRRVVAR